MLHKFKLLLAVLMVCSHLSFAQNEKRVIKEHINILTSDTMYGRGYVFKGCDKAALYIKNTITRYGLLPFDKNKTYYQPYSFSVNTFPNDVLLKVNKTVLVPGVDFLVDAASSSYETDGRIKIKRINLSHIKDSVSWARVKSKLNPRFAYLLKNTDTVIRHLKFNHYSFPKQLPKGLYLIPQHGKITWTVSTEQIPAAVITIEDTVLPNRPKKAAVRIGAHLNPKFATQNVMGYVRGTEIPDSFIVFSAHYDHLGKMGQYALFPGANDNASGTSLVLYLAKYFANHPQRYSIAFIFFSGEEAGLLGSGYYVQHPVFPLEQIKFLINIDLAGEAKNGITVVNAVQQNEVFNLLDSINKENHYLPEIKKRDQAHNSDHWHFCNASVPGIFIYTNGTKPYYHDVFDRAKEITLENIDQLSRLLIDFTGRL
ncbi:MAG: M28 family peptidase [Bacteroidetes bacterium]|nr:M28 family peptidase [Bacteroidota bacterium]